MKILVTTHPFNADVTSLKNLGYEIHYNDKKKKYTQQEVTDKIQEVNPDIIIAGTEKYSVDQLDLYTNLKMIARLGVGIDSIDLNEVNRRNIVVMNTPEAPTEAVSELTISMILMGTKRILEQQIWNKVKGKNISECVIGIIGFGRIGKSVYEKIQSFNPKGILINDKLYQNSDSIDDIIQTCDVITLHVPDLDKKIDYNQLSKMKKDVILINTARGKLLNEKDLVYWLRQNKEAQVFLDVYEKEPYSGELQECSNAFLTPHIGSYTFSTRKKMEEQCVKNILTFIKGK